LLYPEFHDSLYQGSQGIRIFHESEVVMLQVEEARAYSNLGSSHHYRRNFAQAISYHENVLRIAQELGDRAVEARAYAGLGHAARCAGDYTQV
jgi:tetratricopeptide (TPR) repeat protein